jgi:hypothetical protein
MGGADLQVELHVPAVAINQRTLSDAGTLPLEPPIWIDALVSDRQALMHQLHDPPKCLCAHNVFIADRTTVLSPFNLSSWSVDGGRLVTFHRDEASV